MLYAESLLVLVDLAYKVCIKPNHLVAELLQQALHLALAPLLGVHERIVFK